MFKSFTTVSQCNEFKEAGEMGRDWVTYVRVSEEDNSLDV